MRDEGDNLSAVPVHMLCYKAEPASGCELCITPDPSTLALMFCHNCLEIIYDFLTKRPTFYFSLGHANAIVGPVSGRLHLTQVQTIHQYTYVYSFAAVSHPLRVQTLTAAP